jgi:hypothetical protein
LLARIDHALAISPISASIAIVTDWSCLSMTAAQTSSLSISQRQLIGGAAAADNDVR